MDLLWISRMIDAEKAGQAGRRGRRTRFRRTAFPGIRATWWEGKLTAVIPMVRQSLNVRAEHDGPIS